MVKYTGRGLVVKRPGVLSKVQMLTLVLGVGVFSLLPTKSSRKSRQEKELRSLWSVSAPAALRSVPPPLTPNTLEDPSLKPQPLPFPPHSPRVASKVHAERISTEFNVPQKGVGVPGRPLTLFFGHFLVISLIFGHFLVTFFSRFWLPFGKFLFGLLPFAAQ